MSADTSTGTAVDTAVDIAVDTAQLEPRLAEHRGQLTGYCYRMLGSAFDAEDAVQETMLRAWKGLDSFEQRAALRSWLFRIATNVCLTMIESRSRRARPVDLSASAWEPVEASLGARRPEDTWLEPMVDSRVLPGAGDPAEIAVARESVRLAFIAALQHLPPRQRAVLLLRDVLRWRADEVATLLGSTTASVNSALQRARATLADLPGTGTGTELSAADQHLLERYVAAFEAYDMAALATLLADDVTQNMPPFEMWLEGADDLRTWMLGPGRGCRGSRLVPVGVNGQPGFAHYRPTGPDGAHEPFALVVLELRDGAVQGITSFLDTRLFALFAIPATPEG